MAWTACGTGVCQSVGGGRALRVGVVALAVGMMGVALLFTRGVEVFDAQRVKRYVPVEATVLEVGASRGGSRREPFVPAVRYAYSAGGHRYEQSTFGPTPPFFKTECAALAWLAGDGVEVGGLVEAYHDPGDPSRAVLTTYADPKRLDQSVVALVMGGVMSLGGAGVLGVMVWRWSRRDGPAVSVA